jgi:hypothetical protein
MQAPLFVQRRNPQGMEDVFEKCSDQQVQLIVVILPIDKGVYGRYSLFNSFKD